MCVHSRVHACVCVCSHACVVAALFDCVCSAGRKTGYIYMCVCVCVHLFGCVCVYVCVFAHECVCSHTCGSSLVWMHMLIRKNWVFSMCPVARILYDVGIHCNDDDDPSWYVIMYLTSFVFPSGDVWPAQESDSVHKVSCGKCFFQKCFCLKCSSNWGFPWKLIKSVRHHAALLW